MKVNDRVRVTSDVSRGSVGVVDFFDNGKVFVWFENPITIFEHGIVIDNVYEISVSEGDLAVLA